MNGIDRFREQRRDLHYRKNVGRGVVFLVGGMLCAGLFLSILGTANFASATAIADAILTRLLEDPSPCVIKGEVTITNQRIFHPPSSPYYDQIAISTRRGERWFCTEEDARQAGWQPFGR